MDEDEPLLGVQVNYSASTSNRRGRTSRSSNRKRWEENFKGEAEFPALQNRTNFERRQRDHSLVLQYENPTKDLSNWLCSNGLGCLQCVRTKEVGILQRFGKFTRLAPNGLVCIPWPCVRVASRVSLRLQQLDVSCETKTKDNVFVIIKVAILYNIEMHDAYRAFYSLTGPEEQMQAIVYDLVRKTIPYLGIDEIFVSKDMTLDLLRCMQQAMTQYGYSIVDVLVIEISPNGRVKDAMNEINACKRLKEAASHKAEAGKIRVVKLAEATAESMYLQGIGTSKERSAIVKGIENTVLEHCGGSKGNMTDYKTTTDILLVSQYYDMLSVVGRSSSNKMVLEFDAVGR